LAGCTNSALDGKYEVKFYCENGASLVIEGRTEVVRTGRFILNLSVFESADVAQEFLYLHKGEMMSVVIEGVVVCRQKVGYVYREKNLSRFDLVLIPDDADSTSSALRRSGVRVYRYGETGLVVPVEQLK